MPDQLRADKIGKSMTPEAVAKYWRNEKIGVIYDDGRQLVNDDRNYHQLGLLHLLVSSLERIEELLTPSTPEEDPVVIHGRKLKKLDESLERREHYTDVVRPTLENKTLPALQAQKDRIATFCDLTLISGADAMRADLWVRENGFDLHYSHSVITDRYITHVERATEALSRVCSLDDLQLLTGIGPKKHAAAVEAMADKEPH